MKQKRLIEIMMDCLDQCRLATSISGKSMTQEQLIKEYAKDIMVGLKRDS